MAIFTNQAQLLYGNTVINSNIAVGEITDVLSMTKTAVQSEYGQNDRITYIISLVNSGDTPLSSLTLTDDLGAYTVDTATVTPLDYTEGTVQYFSNGIEQAAPTVTATAPLTVTGITVPANGNAMLIYEAGTNVYTPPSLGATIQNTVSVDTAMGTVEATASVTSEAETILSIAKSVSPIPVTGGDRITYTFLLQNAGNTAVTAEGGAVITDTFDPILSDLSVTFNDTAWTAGTNYTYNAVSGEFQSTAGNITVPAATFVQNEDTGAWDITPGTSTLVISGTLQAVQEKI